MANVVREVRSLMRPSVCVDADCAAKIVDFQNCLQDLVADNALTKERVQLVSVPPAPFDAGGWVCVACVCSLTLPWLRSVLAPGPQAGGGAMTNCGVSPLNGRSQTALSDEEDILAQKPPKNQKVCIRVHAVEGSSSEMSRAWYVHKGCPQPLCAGSTRS